MNPLPARVNAGVPTGGRFAAAAHHESAVALSDEPDQVFTDRVGQVDEIVAAGMQRWWESDGTEPHDTTQLEFADVAGMNGYDEDELVERFGEDITNHLLRWTAESTCRSRATFAATMQDSAEGELHGTLEVFDEDGARIGSWGYTHEDPPNVPDGWLGEHLSMRS